MNSTSVQISPSLALTLGSKNVSSSSSIGAVVTDSKIQKIFEKANLTMVPNKGPSPFIPTIEVGLQLLGIALLGYICFTTYTNYKALKNKETAPALPVFPLVKTDVNIPVDAMDKEIITHTETPLPESVITLVKALSQYKEAKAKESQDPQEIEQKAQELLGAWDVYQEEKALKEAAQALILNVQQLIEESEEGVSHK